VVPIEGKQRESNVEKIACINVEDFPREGRKEETSGVQ